MSHGGKGDTPRPFGISQEEFAARHEAIFGRRPQRTPYVYVPPESAESAPDSDVRDSEPGDK